MRTLQIKNNAEDVLKCSAPSDAYNMIPKSKRKVFEAFARCFGISREDIERIRNSK